jgi:RHS repeat-associated protein
MITTSQLSENSHQGFEGLKASLYLGSMAVKSNTASGMQLRLRQTRIGSRSSGKERDAETGLDYFGARYFSAAQGRFTTPDWSSNPESVPYAKLDNPQTLNLYAYVHNNPLNLTDPDGHIDCDWCKDLAIGVGKELANAAIGVNNLVSSITGLGNPVLTPIKPIKPFEPDNNDQDSVMFATRVGTLMLGEAAPALENAVTKGAELLNNIMPAKVTHFTNLEGMAAISSSGNLRATSFVAKTKEVTGKTAGEVENLLDISSGKGQFSITTTTTRGNLAIPENGSIVPGGQNGGMGGVWQRQLIKNVTIDPRKFKKIPE